MTLPCATNLPAVWQGLRLEGAVKPAQMIAKGLWRHIVRNHDSLPNQHQGGAGNPIRCRSGHLTPRGGDMLGQKKSNGLGFIRCQWPPAVIATMRMVYEAGTEACSSRLAIDICQRITPVVTVRSPVATFCFEAAQNAPRAITVCRDHFRFSLAAKQGGVTACALQLGFIFRVVGIRAKGVVVSSLHKAAGDQSVITQNRVTLHAVSQLHAKHQDLTLHDFLNNDAKNRTVLTNCLTDDAHCLHSVRVGPFPSPHVNRYNRLFCTLQRLFCKKSEKMQNKGQTHD